MAKQMSTDTSMVRTVNMPEDMWRQVDIQAQNWNENRSATIRRIISEWAELRAARAQFITGQPTHPTAQ